jgi:hypothetical protein
VGGCGIADVVETQSFERLNVRRLNDSSHLALIKMLSLNKSKGMFIVYIIDIIDIEYIRYIVYIGRIVYVGHSLIVRVSANQTSRCHHSHTSRMSNLR